jgi:DNA ligase-1
MELRALVEQVVAVRAATRRTDKVALLADGLRQTSGRETELAALYLSGSLPQGRIGIGWRTLESALVQAAGASAGAGWSLTEVDRVFTQLADTQGAGAQQRRGAVLVQLMTRAAPEERRFLAQLVLGELRQGALEGLVVEAIARASGQPASSVRQAVMYAGDTGRVARAALEHGAAGLATFTLRVLAPVGPMLASPADDVADALERLGRAAFEYKLDGVRIQLHKLGADVRVFTRQLQDVTPRVPELVEWARALPVHDLVLDGEAIALRGDGRPEPFQVTMSRLGRTQDVVTARQRQPLSAFFFDMLWRAPEGALVGAPYSERMRLLALTIAPQYLLPRLLTEQADEAGHFLRAALAAGHEGLMAKALDAPYAAGQRGFHWLKVKPAHTLDLVVLAAEWGSGRRQGWLSNLHLGARDGDSGAFVMLGKTFKGLTDELLRWQTEQLLAREQVRDGFVVQVRPELVVEVAFGDVQTSPRYPAGLALRFARVKRYRPDKPASAADTLATVRELFER